MAYRHLSRIEHEPTKAALKDVMDDVGALQKQATAIGSVTQPLATPLDANGQALTNLPDATADTDAVHLRRVRQEIQGALQTFAKQKGL